ncbi:MAG: RsbRD N-terminal domain-containing protein [Planctomycetes bacterium]|nr:RsbRD N-terminal domain-containing protein [Planctomycetota bacterium]
MDEQLQAKRAEIVRAWVERTVEMYPADAAKFLLRVNDPFSNPVGTTIALELEFLFDALLRDVPPDEVVPRLDRVIQITSVQDVGSARAVSFVFALKEVIRRALAADRADAGLLRRCLEFEQRIDALALLAFDSCSRFLQRIADIRVREAKRRVWSLMRMLKVDWDHLPAEEEGAGG